jgi:NADH dehydrogenase/NADH:ubiquinone oxidoreductase subunit G
MIITIDGKKCEVQEGEYILEAAKSNGIHIPTLCHNEALSGIGSCRLCIVEVVERNRSKVVTSCLYPITSEIEVLTNTEKIIGMRRTIIMLLHERAPQNEYIQELCREYGVETGTRFEGDKEEDCILCGLCVKACEEVGKYAISTVNRGITKKVTTPYDEPSADCIGCGACEHVCPTKAIGIEEKDGLRKIWNRIFELIKCEECGEHFASKDEYDYGIKRAEVEEERILCDRCKKKLNSEKLKSIYEKIVLG